MKSLQRAKCINLCAWAKKVANRLYNPNIFRTFALNFDYDFFRNRLFWVANYQSGASFVPDCFSICERIVVSQRLPAIVSNVKPPKKDKQLSAVKITERTRRCSSA